jgi:hypothetical protein
MTPATNGISLENYHLVASTHVYSGECQLCTRQGQKIFSLHQAPSEAYSFEKHGELEKVKQLIGIYKNIEMEECIDDEKVSTTYKIFHQVAKDYNGYARVYTPIHAACITCIKKIQKLSPYKCHVCRQDITVLLNKKNNPTPSHNQDHHNFRELLMRRTRLNPQTPPLQGQTLFFEIDELDFRSMTTSQKRAYARGCSFTSRMSAAAFDLQEDEVGIESEDEDIAEREDHTISLHSFITNFQVRQKAKKINFNGIDEETIDCIKNLMREDGLSNKNFFSNQKTLLRQASTRELNKP